MIELRVLGTVNLQSRTGPSVQSVLAQPKRLALLVYLTLATPRSYHRRDKLLALFWPELDTDRGRDALNQALRFLRRSLGNELIVSRGMEEVGVDHALVHCDALHFEELLEAGRGADALSEYRGGLLDGFHVSAAVEFDTWLEQERTRLRGRARDAAAALREAAAEAGDTAAALIWARRALSLAGEEIDFRRLLALYEESGDRAAALRAYQEFAERLKAELDIEPAPETRALVERLRAPVGAAHVDPLAQLIPSPAPSPVPASEPGRALPSWPIRQSAWLVGVLIVLLVTGAGAWALAKRGVADPPIRAIAVLPLGNLTGDSGQAYFVDGMHDALISELHKVAGLVVISRTSVMRFQGHRTSIPEIAAQLDVDAVIEGTVYRAGDSVRVTAQLFRAQPEKRLWSDTYYSGLRDVRGLHSRVVRDIAREIQLQLTAADESRLARAQGTGNPAAYELYLQGRHALATAGAAESDRPIRLFERAAAIDSGFAAPYSAMAAAYVTRAMLNPAQRSSFERARNYASLALARDRTSAEAHRVLGTVHFLADWDWLAADRAFRSALAYAPGEQVGRYAAFLIAIGRIDEGLALAQRARSIESSTPAAIQTHGYLLLVAGRFDAAVAEFQRAIALDPAGKNFSTQWAFAELGWAYALQRRCGEAVRAADKAETLSMQVPWYRASLAWVRAVCGQETLARAALELLTRHAAEGKSAAFAIAVLHAGLGEAEQSIAWLERAFQQHDSGLVFLRQMAPTFFAKVNREPAFQDLLRRMRFPT